MRCPQRRESQGGLLLNTIRTKLRQKAGETLLETLISLGVFAVFMLVITLILAVSADLLEVSQHRYADIQAYCAQAEGADYAAGSGDRQISLRFSIAGAGSDSQAQVVEVYEHNPIVHFGNCANP